MSYLGLGDLTKFSLLETVRKLSPTHFQSKTQNRSIRAECEACLLWVLCAVFFSSSTHLLHFNILGDLPGWISPCRGWWMSNLSA